MKTIDNEAGVITSARTAWHVGTAELLHSINMILLCVEVAEKILRII